MPAAEYTRAVEQWTRHEERYKQFESRLFVRATYFSPSFASAYAAYEAKRLALPRARQTERLAELNRSARTTARFFLSVATHEPLWNDLDRKGGSFRVVLIEGDDEISPVRIERLSQDELADARFFFGYAGPLDTGYWVEFPRPANPKRVHLRLAGPPAVLDLTWNSR